MSKKISYSKYLNLERIINSQELVSSKNKKPIHDEMLFIIIHQIYELWFKQIIHELDSIIEYLQNPNVTESNINIIGGGLIGAITALTLSKLGLKITVVEKKPIQPNILPLSVTATAGILYSCACFMTFLIRKLLSNKEYSV